MDTSTSKTEDGKNYVLVGGDETPETSSSNATAVKDEPAQCPEIVYKVQYKDFSGDIKGTKLLDAPYKLKKTSYGATGTPILEVLYSVTVWFPKIYKKGRGEEKDTLQEKDKDDKENFDERSMEDKELIIHSEAIIKALRAIVDYYPGQSLLGDTISMKEPFGILVHFRKELQEYKETCGDAEAYHHIGILQKYLADNLGDKILEEDQRYTKPTPVATFEMLWMLFKPGMDVYAQLDDQRGGFVVQSCCPHVEGLKFGYIAPFKIIMWYLDFDGRMLGRRSHEVIIAPFEGEREITSLKVFPAKFLDDNQALSPRKRLEDRGEKFYSMLMGKQMDYKGYSMAAEKTPKRFHEGRVVVDQGSFYTYAEWEETSKHPAPTLGVDDDDSGVLAGLHYDCDCNECLDTRRAASGNSKWGSYENIDPRDTPSLAITKEDGLVDRHRYFLCPRRIMGFDLKSKKWQALDVDCCRAPKIKTEAIENLVLPSDKQELIKALVHKYSSSRNKKNSKAEATWSADPIPNKGEGQIFLLHGPPGAGKTFTAECVAEFTSRPLLSLTCGDIGTDEFTVEESLSKWFKLAEIWGAVMLIDEADVYLERREVNELTRNGLVSVFLRAMEYYRGILFLTTNRVGHFDPAFFSRIHVYIGYRPLDAEGRKRIWVQFFQKLETERGDEISVKAGAKRYVLSDDVLKDIEWNGREIRNAFQTAVALAEYEAEVKLKKKEAADGEGDGEEHRLEIELRQDHFEKVVEMSDNFKKYLSTVDADGKGDRGDDSML
ncbi:ATPase family AAA domain-containing protein 3-B [Lachnellula occidentalis]|uniref:ATPase family AAA domain-containing protein 3-B n=1 Tax=Lachnellula occidentalis TaxID=215460 RepID=A0A8H8RVZ8_9HELO|nr:ATPase family AAA domain-containing protein 3-B [Lachnellula occidentalis]